MLTGSAPVTLMEEFSEKKNTVTFNKPHKQVSNRLSAVWTERDEGAIKRQMWIF